MMADVSFDHAHTAWLIADFYTARMNTLPHAQDRQVIETPRALQRWRRDRFHPLEKLG